MEEEKAAAYYEELTRKGEGAARFKQGLGFSSSSTNNNEAVPARGSAFPSASSSFLSSFVKASSPSKSYELEKQSQLESIQNKLKKKPNSSENQNHTCSRVSNDHSRDRDSDRRSRRRSRSREDHRSRRRRRRRSRSRSVSDEERGRRGKGRSTSVSPRVRDPRLEKNRGDGKVRKEKNGGVDLAKVIQGYDKMTPAERVKAKMKHQLSETAEQDATKGMGSGWERFNFDKDAPLDDVEIEAADDDVELVKHIGQSFRFSAVEARREEKIKATHDEAMFGTSSLPPPVDSDSEVEGDIYKSERTETAPVASLISDQVQAMQQGSWRDRARKV